MQHWYYETDRSAKPDDIQVTNRHQGWEMVGFAYDPVEKNWVYWFKKPQ